MKDLSRRFSKLIVAALVISLTVVTAQTAEELGNPDAEDWPVASRTLEGQRFSPLDQITTENVQDLRLAWSRALGFEGSVQFTPAVYKGVMYINGNGVALALDATDGTLLWEYRPETAEGTPSFFLSRNRGSVVIYDGTVYYARGDGIIAALDAATGEELWTSTVTNIGLSEGLTAGPIFADGKIIIGPSGADFGGNPGKVHALNAEDGEILWTFNVIPGPGDPGYDTWDPKPTGEPGYGGGSTWVPGVYDPESRTVIYGTGQPTPWDRYELRKGSADLYTTSFVALDVDTGELKWYHQVVPADEWDADQIVTPFVADLDIDGEMRRVAVLSTTTGFLVRIDINTGEFIAATQMMPETTVHLGYEEDGTPIINDEARLSEPGETKLVCPFRWASYELGSYSPQTGLYYRPNDFTCWDNYTTYPLEDDWQPGNLGFNYESTNDVDRFDRLGALSAINPATGEVVWEFTHGYSQRAGAVATAGDVVFAAFPDRIFRAFDASTGEVLWEQILTSTTNGNPISYAVDGVQYVAVPIGGISGTGQEGTAPTVGGPPTMFVFALPQ